MGVPRFFSWVSNNYPVITDPIVKPNEFYFDLNCLLHPKCFEVVNEILKENPTYFEVMTADKTDRVEAKMFARIIEYMNEILDFVQPQDLLYIAVDGVAPMAKMKHQRLRRFKTIKEQEIRNSIMENFKVPIQAKWNNAVITPGTNFMRKLTNKLIDFSKKYSPKYTNKLKIIFSSCHSNGEGEHKIHQYLKEENNKEATKVVYGLDADLLFLTMATNLPKLYVFREAQEIDFKSTKKFLSVDMDGLKDGIFDDIQKKCNKKLDKSMIINDYIMMGFLLGNDFLPNIPSLSLSPIHPKLPVGLDILLDVYAKFINNNNYLYNDNGSFLKFIEILANMEEAHFKEVYNKGRITYRTNETEPVKIALFELDNLTKSDVNFINVGKDDPEKYKKRYYEHMFGIKMNKVNEICNDYLIGIQWVSKYYFENCPDWLWLYKHNHSPFISDIYNYLKTNKMPEIKVLDNRYAIKPLEQLIMVIPEEISSILPIECRQIFKNKSLLEYFKKDYDFDIFMKTKFWMCHPEILNPSYDAFMPEIKKIKLTEESQKLNKNFKPIEISFKLTS